MATFERGALKLARSAHRFKRVAKLVVYIGVCMAVIQLVAYRPSESPDVAYPDNGTADEATTEPATQKSTTQTTTTVWGSAWLQRQESRRSRIRSHCPQQDALTLDQVLSQQHFSDYDFMDLAIVDEAHQLIYCGVPKVATTNWKRVFLVLNGKARPDLADLNRFNPHDMSQFKTLNDYPPPERARLVATYRKFLFVRHPFNRLDSAYYDRLRYDPTQVFDENFQQLIGTEIIRRYRNPNITTADSLRRGHDVHFGELAQYLTDETNPVRLANGHFAPISSLCFPCQVRYDWVGKYETLVDDARHILAQVNVSLPFIFPPSTNQGSKTSDRWAMDMRSLTPQLRQALLREYRRDFDLFDYDPDEWRKL